MDKKLVAKELIKIAKSLMAGKHDDVKIEKSTSYGKNYWGGEGLYQKEIKELQENDALGSWAHKYYRFYNDGDIPHGIPGIPMGITRNNVKGRDDIQTKIAQALEYWADEKIMEDWKKYQRKKSNSGK